jgi:hypothetical protein
MCPRMYEVRASAYDYEYLLVNRLIVSRIGPSGLYNSTYFTKSSIHISDPVILCGIKKSILIVRST